MNTNHNRIRVADLETNQQNKVLKTNQNGELEFSDLNNLKTDGYNGLDYTAEGKALDARQGKVLKEMIDNSVSFANDQETQITSAVTEDKKVLSRLKLFNWWNWIKLSETLDAVTNRGNTSTKSISVNGTTSNPVSFFLMRGGNIIAKLADVGLKSQLKLSTTNTSGFEQASNMIEVNPLSLSSSLLLLPITKDTSTKTLALKDDFLKTPPGTAVNAPLIIPNGSLTTTPQNGAIERDSRGELYHVVNNVRYKIVDSRDYNILLNITWKSAQIQNAYINTTYVNMTQSITCPISTNALGNSDYGNYLFKTFDDYLIRNGNYPSTSIPPKSILFEVFLKGNNCKFSGIEYVKLYSVERTDILTENSIRNYEIPLKIYPSHNPGDNTTGSTLTFAEASYDNLGIKTSEIYKKIFLQSLTYTGNYTDFKFSEASISLEYRVTVSFSDTLNQNTKNANARPIFANYSSMFLKL